MPACPHSHSQRLPPPHLSVAVVLVCEAVSLRWRVVERVSHGRGGGGLAGRAGHACAHGVRVHVGSGSSSKHAAAHACARQPLLAHRHNVHACLLRRACLCQQSCMRRGLGTCIVRMSKRPRKSFTLTSRSNMVLNRSADVPEYLTAAAARGGRRRRGCECEPQGAAWWVGGSHAHAQAPRESAASAEARSACSLEPGACV